MPTKHKNKKETRQQHESWLNRLNRAMHTRLFWIAGAGLAAAVLIASAIYFYPRYFSPAPQLPDPPLKNLAAEHHVQLGTLVYPQWLKRRPFEQIVSSQFDLVTSDNELHWDKMRPTPTTYNFAPLDTIVAYARAHNMAVQGHHLVWNENDSLPKWLRNGNYTSAELLDMMHQHISTVVGHYKGKIDEWTVVNEPFTRAVHTYGLDNWWGDRIGDGFGYIDKAFTWAHQADPNAKLILNDFNNETENNISDAQYAYMKAAKSRGVPIDGIGMQMHLDATQPPDEKAMVKNMQRFGAIGYKVYITEFDINAMTLAGSADYKRGVEARITSDVAQACIEAANCVSINLFGITDRKNVISFTHARNRENSFTSTYQPKPAFFALRSALSAP